MGRTSRDFGSSLWWPLCRYAGPNLSAGRRKMYSRKADLVPGTSEMLRLSGRFHSVGADSIYS